MAEPKQESPAKQAAQVDKFRDLARELECDDDEARFDEKLKKLASVKPAPEPPNADAE